MKIIINADDFGLSHDVNMAIVEAFDKGYITNTTIMVNMPGFEEAVELSKQHGFFDKVGLHFNVFAGEPLSDRIKKCSLFMEDGVMTSRKFFHESTPLEKMPYPFTSRETLMALKDEANAQIKKYKDAGFTQMHFDSHGHSHTFPIVWSAIASVFYKNGFKTTRKSLNLPKGSFVKNVYKAYFNNIRIKSFHSTSYFTSGTGFILSKGLLTYGNNESIEIMVHPVFEENMRLHNLGNHPDLPEIASVAKDLGKLISFGEL